MYKHIKYKAELSARNTEVIVTILEQTHKSSEFGSYGSRDFRNSVAILSSSNSPEATSQYFFVRGTDRSKDLLAMKFTLEWYQEFKNIVLAYNEYFKE